MDKKKLIRETMTFLEASYNTGRVADTFMKLIDHLTRKLSDNTTKGNIAKIYLKTVMTHIGVQLDSSDAKFYRIFYRLIRPLASVRVSKKYGNIKIFTPVGDTIHSLAGNIKSNTDTPRGYNKEMCDIIGNLAIDILVSNGYSYGKAFRTKMSEAGVLN